MTIDDHLRVARQAQAEGRSSLREAMLTLAIAASGPDDAWAERCRASLVAARPGHFLGMHASLGATLADPRVVRALAKLREQHPPVRVRWLVQRSETIAGPFTGEAESRQVLLDALIGPAAWAEVRRDRPSAARGPLARARLEAKVHAGANVLPLPAAWAESETPGNNDDASGDAAEFAGFYLTVLLAIAALLSVVSHDRATRAA